MQIQAKILDGICMLLLRRETISLSETDQGSERDQAGSPSTELLRGVATVVDLLWPSPLAVFATHTFLKRVWCHMPLPTPSHGTKTNQPKCCPPTEPFNSQPSPSNSWPVTPPLSAQWHLQWHHLCLCMCVCVRVHTWRLTKATTLCWSVGVY